MTCTYNIEADIRDVVVCAKRPPHQRRQYFVIVMETHTKSCLSMLELTSGI